RIYPTIDFYADVTIHLLDGADRVIPGMDPRLSKIAARRLEQQRVRVLLKTLVSEIGPGVVRTKDGAQLRARTIVWSGGVKVNPLVASLDPEERKTAATSSTTRSPLPAADMAPRSGTRPSSETRG